MSDEIVYRLNSYMKKCILNCVKRYAKKEMVSKMREISLDEISEKLNNNETALLSDKDNCAVFDFYEESRIDKKLEEYFSDDEIGQAVEKLSDQEKDILILSILGGYTSEQIGKKYNLSASTVRVIIHNAKSKVKKIIMEDYKMEDIIKNLALAKAGDVIATEKLLKRYSSYINYLIDIYKIDNVNDCKDEIRSVLLNAIQKFKI